MNTIRHSIRIGASGIALSLLAFVPSPTRAGVLYSNGFEAGDPGTSDFYDSTTGVQGQNIAAVANGGGVLGLTAPSGTHYAEITNTDDAYFSPGYGESVYTDYGFSRNGLIAGPGVATGGAFYQSTKYYINTNWAAPAATFSPAFWIDTTPSEDPGNLDETNFRVNVPGNGTVQVAGFVGNPGTNGAVATITSSGWYTFKTTFENSGGLVSNDLSVIDPSGVTIGSFSGVTTLPFAALDGTNYGDWTTVWQNGFGGTQLPGENGAPDVMGIDDVQVGTVPEPTSLSLLAVGGLALLRRRRRTCAI
jgi:hypothetical protein